jgi:hypothetical protein
MKVKQKEREQMASRSESFAADRYEYEDATENPPDLDRFYGPLRNYVKMVTGDYHRLFMLDASGGLGKTYNVTEVLQEELDLSEWTHNKGFTTPVELYKTLWKAQERGHVLFLDDMSGLRNNQKAIDMLKAATETDGEENWIEYRTSQDIEHPEYSDKTLPNTFCFRGRLIMSFNDTPDTPDFNALKDRGVFYQFDLDYEERLDLIREAAKLSDFSELTVPEQQEVAEWIATVTNPAITVSLRTFEEVCSMRHYGQMESQDWEQMAFEIFDLDYEKHLIIRMREQDDMKVEHQIKHFKEETGRSQSYYYKLLNKIKSERMD